MQLTTGDRQVMFDTKGVHKSGEPGCPCNWTLCDGTW